MAKEASVLYDDDFLEELKRREVEEEIIKKNELRKEISKQRKLEKLKLVKRLIFVSVFCGISIILMCGYVNITAERAKLAKLQNELKIQSDINKELKLQIDGKFTLSEIERIATEKYSMTYPDSSQVIYVTVNSSSGKDKVLAKKDKANYNNRIFSIINFIKKLF
ncbi:Septum formation initiator [Caldicellulosiruptor saccharolyticus DSM 8903]|uniref:Septum formation initiator n=1 Tax=Caldicellulosiruptor saccharolyticus (strain ATCC 43494 / DSM 8903 / Tp8T 6331) TaxID=351627 RepID=A4XHZ7_CALS8|nr:cell division protein FtsL [Caldicellulosiruptor saccharolyticus]ABP66532.1 Septum formation initiator [Caldicellulosiruptor saccharolyticus DSM 8903]